MLARMPPTDLWPLSCSSPRALALLYGVLPLASKELVSYTVYRWECAIRASVVMGFVGAGGLEIGRASCRERV